MQSTLSKDETLARFIRQVSASEVLFKQGDLGSAMYIILEGSVELLHKVHHAERLVGVIGAGEVIGEKAILKEGNYRRTFTAVARTNLSMIEVDKDNWKIIQTRMPEFTFKMLRMLSERLDEANELIGILQSTDEGERVIQYLLFVCKFHSHKTQEGLEIILTAKDVGHAINMKEPRVAELLEEITLSKALKKTKTGYTVLDKNLLEEQVSVLRTEKKAA